ncbi:MAG: DUF493 family protein [Bdellovibrionales bacterium]|nr:DUF493 family protein [Bdellovibrionales bacterium]
MNSRAKELLDAHHKWPEHYTFKFVIPESGLTEFRALFAGQEFEIRRSEKGRYLALRLTLLMESSEAVLAVYAKAEKIEGIIAL